MNTDFKAEKKMEEVEVAHFNDLSLVIGDSLGDISIIGSGVPKVRTFADWKNEKKKGVNMSGIEDIF